jgi:hypothetical protein
MNYFENLFYKYFFIHLLIFYPSYMVQSVLTYFISLKTKEEQRNKLPLVLDSTVVVFGPRWDQ